MVGGEESFYLVSLFYLYLPQEDIHIKISEQLNNIQNWYIFVHYSKWLQITNSDVVKHLILSKKL